MASVCGQRQHARGVDGRAQWSAVGENQVESGRRGGTGRVVSGAQGVWWSIRIARHLRGAPRASCNLDPGLATTLSRAVTAPRRRHWPAWSANRLLKLPPMLGYLAVGIVVSPHALALARDSTGVQHGKFSVVFLMFAIGLEFTCPNCTYAPLVFRLGSSRWCC